MTEIISPIDYTPEIRACINELKYKLAYTLADYEPDDFLAVRFGDVVFVLANPVLGEEAIYDDFGRVREYVPMRNITMMYYDEPPPEAETLEHEFCLRVNLPRLRILRPDLCLKLKNGQVTDCDLASLELAATNDWEKQIESLLFRLQDRAAGLV